MKTINSREHAARCRLFLSLYYYIPFVLLLLLLFFFFFRLLVLLLFLLLMLLLLLFSLPFRASSLNNQRAADLSCTWCPYKASLVYIYIYIDGVLDSFSATHKVPLLLSTRSRLPTMTSHANDHSLSSWSLLSRSSLFAIAN